MAKHCEIFDHTADVGLAATADSLVELFEAMAEGLAEMICPTDQVKPAQTKMITLDAEDTGALVVDFLSKVMVTMETELFTLASVNVLSASQVHIEAELKGEPYDQTRHEFQTEVKAVTYHQLSVARKDGKWSAQVILDI